MRADGGWVGGWSNLQHNSAALWHPEDTVYCIALSPIPKSLPWNQHLREFTSCTLQRCWAERVLLLKYNSNCISSFCYFPSHSEQKLNFKIFLQWWLRTSLSYPHHISSTATHSFATSTLAFWDPCCSLTLLECFFLRALHLFYLLPKIPFPKTVTGLLVCPLSSLNLIFEITFSVRPLLGTLLKIAPSGPTISYPFGLLYFPP